MLHTDPRFVEAVTRVVGEVETTTTVEVVVVAAARSDAHARVGALAGAAAAWLAMLLMIVLPWDFSPMWMLVELPLVGGLVAALVPRSEAIMGKLLSQKAAADCVARAAAAAFTEELVHGTRARTGMLVYISGIEGRISVIADGGIEARIPPGEWAALPWCGANASPGPKDLDAFLNGLRTIGRTLAVYLPASPDDNPDELPDAPRVRP